MHVFYKEFIHEMLQESWSFLHFQKAGVSCISMHVFYKERTVVYGVHPKRCTLYHLNTTPQGCNHVVYTFTYSGEQFYLWV